MKDDVKKTLRKRNEGGRDEFWCEGRRSESVNERVLWVKVSVA